MSVALNPHQKALLSRFGLTGDPVLNKGRIEPFAHDPPGTDAYRAVQLARAVASGKFGTPRMTSAAAAGGKKPDWKRTLGTSSKTEYNKKLLNARRRGNKAKEAALKQAYKARLRNRRAEAVAFMAAAKAQRMKAAREQRLKTKGGVTRNARTGLQSYPINTYNVDKRMQVKLASALTILTGVLQDLVKLSGQSLSKLVYASLVLVASKIPGVKLVPGAAATAAASLGRGGALASHEAILKFSSYTVYVLYPFGIKMNAGAVARALQGSKRTVVGLTSNQDVDLRPLVSSLVMALDKHHARILSQAVLDHVLNTYVYTKYVPTASGGGGFMCDLCSRATCGGKKSSSAHNAQASAKLAALLGRAMKAVNILLSIDARGLTLTKALRQAMDTQLDSKKVLALVIQAGAHTAGSTAGKTILAALGVAFGKWINNLLKAYGLGIGSLELGMILFRELPTVRAFVNKDFSRSIEPVLIKIIAAARPVNLVRGIAGAFTSGTTTSEFCALCRTSYAACAR